MTPAASAWWSKTRQTRKREFDCWEWQVLAAFGRHEATGYALDNWIGVDAAMQSTRVARHCMREAILGELQARDE